MMKKFKRELNFSTYNEVVELLFELLNVVQKYRVLQGRYEQVVKNNPGDSLIDNLNELTWEIIETWFKSLVNLQLYFVKRKIILKQFQSNFEKIDKMASSLDHQLWKFKSTIWEHDTHGDLAQSQVSTMSVQAEELIKTITNTIEELQEKYLGHIYK